MRSAGCLTTLTPNFMERVSILSTWRLSSILSPTVSGSLW
jgi:hypothetical protein